MYLYLIQWRLCNSYTYLFLLGFNKHSIIHVFQISESVFMEVNIFKGTILTLPVNTDMFWQMKWTLDTTFYSCVVFWICYCLANKRTLFWKEGLLCILIIYRPIISNVTKTKNDEYQEIQKILFAPNSKPQIHNNAHTFIINNEIHFSQQPVFNYVQ